MGCFLIGVTGRGCTTNGEALLGSVSDDPYDVRTFVRIVHPEKGIAHVGTELVVTRPPSFAERGYFCEDGDTTRGVNAAGLSFTCALLFESETQPKNPHPISFSLLSRRLMNECRDVKEGIDLFRSAEAVSPPFSVLLADSEGAIAHLEAGSFGVELIDTFSKEKPGVVFAVNCYQSMDAMQYGDPKASRADPDNNNGCRLQNGQKLFEQWKGKIDVNAISRILSDHEERERDPLTNPLLEAWGFSICNHGTRQQNDKDAYPLPWGTVSAEILQPSTRTLHYCYGWPCGEKPEYLDQFLQENSWGTFHPFTVDDKVPSSSTKVLTDLKGELFKAF